VAVHGGRALVDRAKVDRAERPPESEDHSFAPATGESVEDLERGEVYL